MDAQPDKGEMKDMNLFQISYEAITRKQENVLVKKVKSRDVYFHCLYPISRPKCIEEWSELLNQYEWETIWDDRFSKHYNRKRYMVFTGR